jgi:cyclic di-GMP phosphodiesterase
VVTIATCEAIMPALEEHAVDVVLLDIGFPEGTGLDVMRQIHLDRRYTDLPIVILSSPTHRDDAIGALGTGADDVVMKPIEPRVLISRVQIALRSHRAMLGMEAARSVVVTLANEINAPDMDIGEHTQRIGAYAAELGRRVGLSAADMHAVAYSTLLHDLGKIGIADSILLKRGPLSADEREAINRHTEIGERIAAPLPGAHRFAPIIRHHHERWDGGGYPDGLEGQAIPMGARIIGIVDAFDAMTQFRPYREPRSVSEAIEELRSERGRQFDPDLVDAFVRILEWDGII